MHIYRTRRLLKQFQSLAFFQNYCRTTFHVNIFSGYTRFHRCITLGVATANVNRSKVFEDYKTKKTNWNIWNEIHFSFFFRNFTIYIIFRYCKYRASKRYDLKVFSIFLCSSSYQWDFNCLLAITWLFAQMTGNWTTCTRFFSAQVLVAR